MDPYAVPALDKGLDILELLAKEPEGLSKSQIARGLNRTVSEIFRMLICLELRGYIAQTVDERFSLTLKLFRLVQEHPPTERLITIALPIMHRLAHDASQSCHLGILEAAHVVIVAQVNPPTAVGFYVKLGSTVDMMEAASGYVLLANQTDGHRQRMLGEWSEKTGAEPPHDLGKHLAGIRRQGYEKRSSYLVEGVTNISFPIFNERKTAVAALTVPLIQLVHSRMRDSDVIEALRQSSLQITAAIGGSPYDSSEDDFAQPNPERLT